MDVKIAAYSYWSMLIRPDSCWFILILLSILLSLYAFCLLSLSHSLYHSCLTNYFIIFFLCFFVICFVSLSICLSIPLSVYLLVSMYISLFAFLFVNRHLLCFICMPSAINTSWVVCVLISYDASRLIRIYVWIYVYILYLYITWEYRVSRSMKDPVDPQKKPQTRRNREKQQEPRCRRSKIQVLLETGLSSSTAAGQNLSV